MFVPIILKKSDCQFGHGLRELLGEDLGDANDRNQNCMKFVKKQNEKGLNIWSGP